MALPSVTFTIQSNNLGQTGTGGQANMIVVVGDSSTGTVNQPYQSPVPGNFVTQFGYGKGVQLAALIAAKTGKSVGFVKATASSAGSSTAVRGASGNTSTSAITLTGAPLDDYQGLVTVQTGGTIGVTGIVLLVSLDNGRTTYATVNLGTASTYAIANTGLTLNFGAGALVAGDSMLWNSISPWPNDASVTCAITALIGKGWDIEDILVPSCSTAGNAIARDSDMTVLFGKKNFARLLTAARDVQYGGSCTENEVTWMSSIIADFQAFTSERVGVCAGDYNCLSPIDGTQLRRNVLFQAGARDGAVTISTDLGETDLGPLSPLNNPNLTGAPDGYVYHDESSNPGLDAARFLTAFTIPGLPGMYIPNANIMAAPGSDFNWLQHGHVIDKFCKILYAFFALKLSSSVRVSSTTGYILEADAKNLELRCQSGIDAGLVNTGDVSSAGIAITRNNNILSTNELQVTGTVVPLAYLKAITVTVAFSNPSIQQV